MSKNEELNEGAQGASAPSQSDTPFKPSLAFLRKVEAGEVRVHFGYSKKRGGYWTYRGGEESCRKHAKAGFCTPYPAADLGRPGIVSLTEAGRAALARGGSQ